MIFQISRSRHVKFYERDGFTFTFTLNFANVIHVTFTFTFHEPLPEIFLGAWICRDIRCGRVLHDQRDSDRANVSLEGEGPKDVVEMVNHLQLGRLVASHVVLEKW